MLNIQYYGDHKDYDKSCDAVFKAKNFEQLQDAIVALLSKTTLEGNYERED